MKIKMICATAVCCAAVSAAGAFAQTPASSADADKTFIQTASQSDYTEIKFSQLAADKGSNPRVKAYAQKMIADHTQLETEMKPFADQMGVTPVTQLDSDHQQKYDALSQMSGADFDKTYMTAMDMDHHKALDLFKQEESTTTDPKFKKVVAKGEKVVAQHTMMADKAVKMMNGGSSAAGM
ncbi:DUF4142 domain-containing protein [Terriglobus aquaticus]|uniref:DUF4142 domain-containing protein n=1 Tax=Terriglobus aquaticus TaxID=940139 RepID=A0ABW9KFA5_9BACT|nr:DUF4142 domain-containing protein [Terriglobus aquaticus]